MQYMEIVASEYLSYGEEQHTVDKLVNMTCKCCCGDTASFVDLLEKQYGVCSRKQGYFKYLLMFPHTAQVLSILANCYI